MAEPLVRERRSDSATALMARNYEFVGDVSKYSCPVCFELMFVPQLLSCCGHHVCDPCLKKIQNSNMAGPRRCPLCQNTDFSTMLNKGMAREVRSVHVYCPNMSRGCDWMGELNSVEEHLSPGVSKSVARACQFETVVCPNEGCKEEVIRRDLAYHQNEVCRYRQVECEYCKDYRSTYDDVTTTHSPNCPARPVDCPNGCGEVNLPRAQLDEHLEKCPHQLIDCDFKSVGCGFRRKREAMGGHLELNTTFHMKLLCRTVTSDRADFEKKVKTLNSEIASLREENLKKSEENSEMRNVNNQLTSKLNNLKKRVEELNQQLQTVKSMREKEQEQVQVTEIQEQVASQISKMEEKTLKTKTEFEKKLEALDRKTYSHEKSMEKLHSDVESQKATVRVLQENDRELSQAQTESLKMAVGKDIDDRVKKVSEDVDKKMEETSGELDKKWKNITDKLDLEVNAQKNEIVRVQQSLEYVEKSLTPRPPYAFTVSRFQERKSHKEAFVSPPFYHNLRGYKMCVRVDVYGMNNHVAVFCCIMRGEHDENLDWPFMGAIKVRLQNHLGDHHHFEKDILFEKTTDEKKSGRVKTGDKNYLHGHPQFIAHSKLAFDAEKNCQYLKGDALDFEVVNVELLPR